MMYTPATPHHIGKYKILDEIGSGGFATVYRAYDVDLERVIALKVMHSYWQSDPYFSERFRREARVIARLRHPHIVTVYAAGEADGYLYIAMEYLPGKTLRSLLQESTFLTLEQAVPIIEQIAAALDYAHAQGLLHRDVKPGNVILEQRGGKIHATLLDFGLVKVMAGSSAITSHGFLLGSPEYMAPEQAAPERSHEVGSPSDRYALGIMAYQMFTGHVPFPGNTPTTLNAHENRPVPPPCLVRPDLPDPVQKALLRMLAKAPDARFQSAGDFAGVLRATMERAAQFHQQEERISTLYAAFRAAVDAENWSEVLRLGGQLQLLAPDHPDVAEWVAEAEEVWQSGVSQIRTAGGLLEEDATGDLNKPVSRVPLWAWGVVATLVLAISLWRLGIFTNDGLPFNPVLGSTWVRPQDEMVLVYVPPGDFEMGAEALYDDEGPVHTVSLDGFWMDRTEVTRGQYARCVDSGACEPARLPDDVGDDYPVVGVSWNDAVTYCTWVGGRLPTEAEWEYAARGPENRLYPWGELFIPTLVNYCDANCTAGWADSEVDDGYAKFAPVGTYPDNESWCGALDLAGNVWEWVQDWYDEDYYARSPSRNPQGPESGTERVIRGGSWKSNAYELRGSYRFGEGESEWSGTSGFRCARRHPEN